MPGELRRRELIDGKFIVTHTVDDSHDGWRADAYLKHQYGHFSRNKLQGLIDDGRIIIDGKRLKASTTLRPGDLVKVITEQTEEPPVELNYGTLYEDEFILVVDKPGNLPVHPSGKFLFHSLLMLLRKERGQLYHLIHRLDRETSGVLLLAKDPETTSLLTREFRERRTEKRYWAICDGHPPENRFSIDADIGSAVDSAIRLKMQAFPKGTNEMDALTHFEVLKRSPGKPSNTGVGDGAREGGVALIDCRLETGRQHQIRVHLAHAGHPVVGDKLYGAGDEAFLEHIKTGQWGEEPPERHALHSRYLRFYHERAGRWLEVESPLPADMTELLEHDT